MTTTTYLLKIEEEEKERWRLYAKEHYRNNLASLIRIAVNQLITRGHDNIESNFDDSKILLEVTNTKNEIQDQLNRIEDMLTANPKFPLGVYLKSISNENEEKKLVKRLKHDF
ncbi:MAG: hypothetical protein IH840_01820 [Candidatus Heimdallarchaeota archaeon]|nr:hypothetical protein [Candidatus Heimdallarchaeota archaeon]